MNSVNYDDGALMRFNEALDEEGAIDIAGIEFQRSRILYELAYDTYQDAYNEFQENEFQVLKQTIFDTYPACIAFTFRSSEKGENANDPVWKLQRLKDTWETIVYVLYALVMGEVRFRNIRLNEAKVIISKEDGVNPIAASFNSNKIFSDAIKQKILNIQAIIKYCKTHDLGFKCEEIDETLMDDLMELQDIRNEIAHHSSLTRNQAEVKIGNLTPIFQKMLLKTTFLEHCRILRFDSFSSKIRCESFNGHSLNREYEDCFFENSQRKIVLELGQDQLFVNWDGLCFSLSPFLHFYSDSTGHESYLCFYKRKKSGKYLYEPLKIGSELAFDDIQSRFESEKDDLVRLLVPS